jgi:threonine synthase
MQYLSTRGQAANRSFSEAVMTGLAEDGGLLLPRAVPRIDRATFEAWQELSYSELAFEIMSRFIDDIPTTDLKELINRSYATFTAEQVVPLVHLDDLHILELFHGPTLAFKDIALQFLGNLFEYLLDRSDGYLNILGATSGDTGSAAIHGVKGRERIRIFILHPHRRISEVQEKQMTTVADANVYNIAVTGTFDDAQAAVKTIFGDVEFKKTHHLGSINSINWARILAQVVYYVYSSLHVAVHEKNRAVAFSVPTGNFGDIFAGYIAKKMLPEGSISKLVLATNSNDILTRFVNKGDYSLGEVVVTSSPSMDIQAASNFERYLFYLMDKEPDLVREAMLKFSVDGKLYMQNYLAHIKRDFVASAVSEEEVQETISRYFRDHHYLLDPHTAIGVKAAAQHRDQGVPMVCLATAHPAKFPDTVARAVGRPLQPPDALAELEGKPSRCEVMDCSVEALMAYIESHALQGS